MVRGVYWSNSGEGLLGATWALTTLKIKISNTFSFMHMQFALLISCKSLCYDSHFTIFHLTQHFALFIPFLLFRLLILIQMLLHTKLSQQCSLAPSCTGSNAVCHSPSTSAPLNPYTITLIWTPFTAYTIFCIFHPFPRFPLFILLQMRPHTN